MKFIYFSVLVFVISNSCSAAKKIEFKHEPSNKKAEVMIDGKLFGALIYSIDLEKQMLYPISNRSEKIITLDYPMNPRPFERTDHPRHVGFWLNFEDVNGHDFRNSFAVKHEVVNGGELTNE